MPPARSRDQVQLTFFLPVNSFGETLAAEVVLVKLVAEFEGLTRSPLEGEGRSQGRFKDKDHPEGLKDLVTVVHVLVPNTKVEGLPENLDSLHSQIHAEYARQASTQQAVWIVQQPVRVLRDLDSPVPAP